MAEPRQCYAVWQQNEVSHKPGSPNDPFFYKPWFPDLVVHDCKKIHAWIQSLHLKKKKKAGWKIRHENVKREG